eukprot:2727825-Rhodomonas_salina.2
MITRSHNSSSNSLTLTLHDIERVRDQQRERPVSAAHGQHYRTPRLLSYPCSVPRIWESTGHRVGSA